MFCVYILRSQRLQKYYVGSTQDVNNRLREHNHRESRSTRKGAPWELIHTEEFPTRAEAMRQENKIKSRGIARYLSSLGKLTGSSVALPAPRSEIQILSPRQY
jgi:putative endonuclease